MSSTHSCSSHRHNLRREESPAQTESLQEAYRKELARRLDRLRGVLRTTISENDALEIGDPERRNVDEPDSGPNIDPRDGFEFTTAVGKQAAFNEQLNEWLDEGVLEKTGEDLVQQGEHYTSIYAEAAYENGVDFGTEEMLNADVEVSEEDVEALMGRPIHQDTLEEIYTRNYQGLQDITEDIDRSLSRLLSEGLANGWNPRKTADRVTAEVRDIQHSRARALARTETMHAHNTGALSRYEGSGVTEVEILTHQPCELCQRIEARGPYAVSEAHGLIPAHPNCVCTVVPAV